MDQEAIRRLARDVVTLQCAGPLETYLALLDDDVVFTSIGTTEVSGTWSGKAAAREVESQVADVFEDGIHLTIDDVIVEGNTAVVTARGRARTRTSRLRYDQTYCFVLRFRKDKVVEFIEYYDTALAERILASG